MSIKVSGVECINDDKRFLNNEDRPAIQPTLNLDFAKTKTLNPRIDFTRSSTATYYDGKTFAKAEENLFNYSEDLSQSYWTKNGLTATINDTTAPDGTTTATKLNPTGTTGAYIHVNDGLSGAVIAGDEYTLSIYAKAGSGNSIRISNITSPGTGAWFNLTNGTIGTQNDTTSDGNTSTITDVGNGWYRCTRTFPVVEVNTNTTFLFGVNDVDGSTNSTTDGYIHVWGAQLEHRSSATAYTPTSGQPITNYIPVLKTAASGAARFDHDPVTGESKGLLIEAQRTNILPYSTFTIGFATADMTKTNGIAVAPDGTLTASSLVPAAIIYGPKYMAIGSGSLTVGNQYVWSVYVKSIGQPSAIIHALGKAPARFEFASESFTAAGPEILDYGFTKCGNGWYRIWITYIAEGNNVYIGGGDSDNNYVYTPANTFDGILVWGGQVEEAKFPTSYIPTSGSTATRILDKAEMIGITDIVNGYQGSVYWEAESQSPDTGYRRVWTLYEDVAAFNDRINFNSNAANNYNDYYPILYFIKNNDASSSASLRLDYPYDWQPSTYLKGAAYWEGTTGGLCLAGGDLVTTDNYGLNTSSTDTHQVPVIDNLTIGGDFSVTTQQLQGTIKKLVFYPKALTTAQLQALTEE